MPTTTVRCSLPECREPASYKIAAPWSDGSFSELRTYGFACSNHLGPVFRAAEERQETYPPTKGEAASVFGRSRLSNPARQGRYNGRSSLPRVLGGSRRGQGGKSAGCVVAAFGGARDRAVLALVGR